MEGHVFETSIVREIKATTDYARAMTRAAAIIGPPGIGKTVGLQHYAKSNPAGTYIRVSAAQGTARAAFRLLADAFSVARMGRQSADLLWRGLKERFESARYWKTGEYLLVDVAQQLDLSVLKELVDLPARFEFPVVVCGNADLLKRTQAERGAYEQISSRRAKRLVLTKPLDSDFLAIAMDFDVCAADVRAAAVSYGKNTSIRELVQLLEDARAFVGKGPLTLAALRQTAVNTKGGSHALKLLTQAA